MRQIKFRAWDNQFQKWATNKEVTGSIGLEFGIKDCFINIAGERMARWSFMQYTGLTDKKGKEIYEGDICNGHSDGIGVIRWTDFDCGYDYVFTDGNNVGIWEVKSELEVIGNIYENPELLK